MGLPCYITAYHIVAYRTIPYHITSDHIAPYQIADEKMQMGDEKMQMGDETSAHERRTAPLLACPWTAHVVLGLKRNKVLTENNAKNEDRTVLYD